MLQVGLSSRAVARTLNSFQRQAMFRSDPEVDARGSRPLHKTGKFSYVFLI